jgi:hypothetical protein
VPAGNGAEHPVAAAAPAEIVQSIPAGSLTMTPLPVPWPPPTTVRAWALEPPSNVAVMVWEELTVIVQGALPGQVRPFPLQPVNVDPDAGLAANVSSVPF